MTRIPFDQLWQEMNRVLLNHGFSIERAEKAARLFAEANLDGVASHGLNRFPRFMEYIEKKYVDIHAEPKQIGGFGAVEQWDGQLGPGNLNGVFCMDRAVELSRQFGIGMAALRRTNHWMRGGAYGWQAAEAGCIGICWTNTLPNMPAWGAKNPVLGNNPLIIAIPRKEGHVILDTAMTQFSFGKLETYRRAGNPLPVPGGFDSDGNLTSDAGAIEKSGRPLPMGFWKGSGLSMTLDLMASMLSQGLNTPQIGEQCDDEYGLSQVFIAMDIQRLGDENHMVEAFDQLIKNLHNAEPTHEGITPRYPGERTLATREENLRLGVPVNDDYWNQVKNM